MGKSENIIENTKTAVAEIMAKYAGYPEYESFVMDLHSVMKILYERKEE